MELSPRTFVLQQAHRSGRLFHVISKSGQLSYCLREKLFSFGRKILVFDADEQHLATIRQAFSPIVPKYRVCIAGSAPFSVMRAFSLLPKYQIKGRPWVVLSSGAHYRCLDTAQADHVVFDLQRATGSWVDRCFIDVYDETQLLPIICTAAAIDAAITDIHRKH